MRSREPVRSITREKRKARMTPNRVYKESKSGIKRAIVVKVSDPSRLLLLPVWKAFLSYPDICSMILSTMIKMRATDEITMLQ